ncbi:MAG TPA: kelch repeat-containing protein [Archangium sp.]|uniref:kelch repeat-containing protein n=1 Tax=Archangium sp. TaxID=1872627 RepID=UPI002ED812F9
MKAVGTEEDNALELVQAYYPDLEDGETAAPLDPETALEVELPATAGEALTLSTRGHLFRVKTLGTPDEQARKRTLQGAAFYGSRHLWTSAGARTETPAGRWVTHRAEEYVVLPAGEKEHRARYEVSVPEGIVAVRDAQEYLEFLDADERPVLRMHYGVARDAQGLSRRGETRLRGVASTDREPARYALVDRTLSVELVLGLEGLSGPVVVDPGWSATGSMAVARWHFATTLLPNGKVLVSGGSNNSSYTATAELYDPASGTWSSAGSMSRVRTHHTMTVLPDGRVLAAGGNDGNGSAATASSADLYNPATNTWTPTGSMANSHDMHTATLLNDGKVLVAGGTYGTNRLGADVYNPATGTWTPTGNMPQVHSQHTAVLLPNGKVLVAGGYGTSTTIINSAALYDPATGTWSSTGSMTNARRSAGGTLLPNGKVLVTGGYNGNASLSSSELYDPATGAWSSTGSMPSPRAYYAMAMLPNGRVLVAGGYGTNNAALATSATYNYSTGTWSASTAMPSTRTSPIATLLPDGQVLVIGGQGNGILSTAIIFDPGNAARVQLTSLAMARANPTATLLPNGKVLVVGGRNDNGMNATPELFDPASTVKPTGAPGVARNAHTATLLLSGKVLVTGGVNDFNTASFSSAEVYDLDTNAWTATGSLATARSRHTATLLPDGRVLVTGGLDGTGARLGSAELYDPTTGTWSSTGSMLVPREGHVALPLSTGKVLVAGGSDGSGPLASAELYDPTTGTWSLTGSLATARVGHTGVPLPTGRVLVAGGRDAAGTFLASAERYDPSTGTWSAAGNLATARDSTTATLLLSGKVLVAGGRRDTTGTSLNSLELYDAKTNAWTTSTVVLGSNRSSHAAVLLTSGRALVVGGSTGTGLLNPTEAYDEVGTNEAWRPSITQPELVTQGAAFTATGSRFRGISEASSGYFETSPTNFPSMVTLMPLGGGALTRLPSTHFSSTSLSAVAPGLRPGHYLLSFTVNAIPGGRVVRLTPGTVTSPDVSFTTVEDTATPVTLAATTSLGQPLTYSVVSPPSHGTLSGTAPDLTYTPEANYYGGDSFQYQAADGASAAIGTVSLKVTPMNDAPVARDLYLVAAPGTPTALTLPGTDPDGDVLAYTVVTVPSHGTISGTGPGLTYTPESGYTGPDSFTYQVSDGNSSSEAATVAINVDSAAVVATAVYDSGLKVPRCSSSAASCDSGTLLNGRGPLGPEPNQPNTIWSTCADGTGGTYHSTPSLDRLKVSTLDGSPLTAGKTVKIEASVWAWLTLDTLELYSSANTSSPTWVRIGTLKVSAAGPQVLSTTYTLPSTVGSQAIRGMFHYSANPTSACLTGNDYVDHDDLVFTVGARDAVVPTTALTSPTSGAVVGGAVTLTATASDNVGVTRVEFYDGATLLGIRTVAPYTYTWNTAKTAEGTHTLTSRAYDAGGNVGTSAPVTVTVSQDVTPPQVTLSSPGPGLVRGLVRIAASATDNRGVTKLELYAGSRKLWTANTASITYDWDTLNGEPSGPQTLRALAYDSLGNVGTAEVQVTVDNDVEPPVLLFTSPEDGAMVSGNIDVTVNVTDNVAVARVDYAFDGVPRASVTSAPFSWSWFVEDTGSALHTVTATAYDVAGNASQPVTLSISVDNSLRSDCWYKAIAACSP